MGPRSLTTSAQEATLPYALTASSVKLVQTNVFICNYSYYIAGSSLDSQLPVI